MLHIWMGFRSRHILAGELFCACTRMPGTGMTEYHVDCFLSHQRTGVNMNCVFHREPERSRRTSIACSTVTAVLSLSSLIACSDSTSPAGNVSGSFVGLAEGTAVTTLVTVDAGQPDTSGMRTVTVYACDSKEQGTIIWFVGRVSGNDFTVASSNGEATVTGRLSQDGVTGKVQDATVTFPYSLRRANPGEGIYTVTVASNGDMQGVSLDGRTRLEGHYPSLGAAGLGALVTTTMIHPDSSRQSFTEPSREATGEGTFRANVIIDGAHLGVRGANFPTTTTRSQLIGSSKIIGLDM
jgi:hypothetical protein